MVTALTWFNVALRGVMEAGIVAALAYWGYRTGQSTWAKIVLGIGAPVLVFGFWGLVDFRKAGRMAEGLRLVQELVISGLAAVALIVAGQPALGWTLGVISVVQHVLVYALGNQIAS
jgi:hypothetical protein